MKINLEFFRNKKVFLTGHTGFKGSWLSRVLIAAGAQVTGYSLNPPTEPNLFSVAGIEADMNSVIGDIRDFGKLKKTFDAAQPELVIHMAAQPIVRTSYQEPLYTYETNIMGTVNLLECARLSNCVKSFLNVTTDKVYQKHESAAGYKENEPLKGYDPYSNSKSCSELVTHSYKQSFFNEKRIPVSTARAGNVFGGGDFAKDRILPDCIRAQQARKAIGVRNPFSTRPYQHVLEPLMAYLIIVQAQWNNHALADTYNVGPDDCDCLNTGQLVDIFCNKWGEQASWINQAEENAPYEDNFLKLDCTKLKTTLGWYPRWHIDEAIELTCEWYKAWLKGENVQKVMDRQVEDYRSK